MHIQYASERVEGSRQNNGEEKRKARVYFPREVVGGGDETRK